jgi:hypothetical protein
VLATPAHWLDPTRAAKRTTRAGGGARNERWSATRFNVHESKRAPSPGQ